MKHGYTCPMVRELWNQKINSGMSILVLGFFHSLTVCKNITTLNKKSFSINAKHRSHYEKCYKLFFSKQMFGPKGVNYDLY